MCVCVCVCVCIYMCVCVCVHECVWEIYIYMCVCVCVRARACFSIVTGRRYVILVKLATIVEGDPKAPFSIATTPRCRGGRYSIPRIAPVYP